MAAMQKAVVTIGQDKIIRSVNREAIRLFGYQRADELIGKSINVLVPPPWKAQHDSYIDNYHRTGIPKVIGRAREVEGEKKDGSVVRIRLSISKITIQDEVFYCGLIEALEDKTGFVTSDDKGVILSNNGTCENIFGYSRGELIGRNVSMLATEPHASLHDDYMRRYRETGVKHVLGRVRNLNGRHKDGSEMPISLLINERIEGGKRTFCAHINQITEQIEAHVTIDHKGTIRSLNQAMWMMFGYAKEELLDRKIKIIMTHPHSEMHDTYLKRYFRTHKKRIIGTTRTLKARHKDGSTFLINLEVNEFMEEGEIMFGGKITRVLSQQEKKHAKEVRYIGNYEVESILAEGLYGQVRLARHHLTKERVIIKTIEKSKVDLDRFREIEVMKYLRHPHVCRLLEVIEAPQKLYIVIQYIEGGELYEYAVTKDKLPEAEARVFWRQIVQGVEYMHSQGIVHRDLKLENIMLDRNRNVVIIDMGLSNFTADGKLLETFCGSSSYAAPEMFLCRRYKGPEVDIWSMGVILYCMVLGYLPFEDPQHIVDADFIPFEPQDNISPEFQDLIHRIFRFDPAERITIEEVRKHPWTNKDMPELEPPPKVHASEVEELQRADLLKKLEEFGFDKNDILKSLSQEDFNQITASFFLLQQQQAHDDEHNATTTGAARPAGGGCPFAHLHSAQKEDNGEKKKQVKAGEEEGEADDGHHHHHHDKDKASTKEKKEKKSKKESKGEKHAHKDSKKESKKDSKKA